MPDENIGHFEPKTKYYTKYEFDRFVFWDSPGFEPGENTDRYISRIYSFLCEQLKNKPSSEHIHILWYCISGEGARIVDFDKIFAKEFPIPTIVILTKNDITTKKQSKEMSAEMGTLKGKVIHTSSDEKTGFDRVLKVTGEYLSQGIASGEEIIRRIKEIEQVKKEKVDTTIEWAAGRAAAIAIIPIPIADVAPLVANEIYMIMKIGAVYGIPLSDSMITALLGVLGASFVGKGLASFIPGLKVPIVAAVTYGVGKAAQAWLENDMKTSDEDLKNLYKKGKEEYKQAS